MRARLLMLLLLALVALVWVHGWRPPDRFNPWARLDLRATPDRFLRYKLYRLADEPALCQATLRQAGADFSPLPDRQDAGSGCGWHDAVRLRATGVAQLQSPAIVSCPLAASLVLLDRQLLQPDARRQFGQSLRQIEHVGSFACRAIYHREQAPLSAHAQAQAIDVSGFRLADGRRVLIGADWARRDARGTFLHQVHDGGCAIAGMLLGPDYNAAHASHFHIQGLDSSWSYCR